LKRQEFVEESSLRFVSGSPIEESLFRSIRSLRIVLRPRQQKARNDFNLGFEFSESRAACPADSEVISDGSHPRNGHLSVQIGKQLIVVQMCE
jgi:hypothetical protein